MATKLAKLLIEALVVAIGLLVLFSLIHGGATILLGNAATTNRWYLSLQIAIAASSFHVACEFTGVNAWYCKQR